jgi:hypothetical protein
MRGPCPHLPESRDLRPADFAPSQAFLPFTGRLPFGERLAHPSWIIRSRGLRRLMTSQPRPSRLLVTRL